MDVFRTVMLKLSVNCGYFSISRQTKSRVNTQPDTGEGTTTLQVTDRVTSRLTDSQTSKTSTAKTSTTTTKETNATGILEEEEGSNNGAVSVTTTLHHFLGTAVIVMKLI
ncbi:hypothetical protein EB796_022390 [Bugula neritina]|uniref:Uncharacterized protein n=1 Tax=Bugula neritina TaxID=10212 RepID=A0A7J7J0U8_BUGNE|nr:hypothetical protein EB796_022390 [Bugula neritina]